MLAGGAVGALAVLVLLPILVPGLIRLSSGLVGRLGGPALRLASANAVRNPRRTATSTAALLVGTTLISAIVVGMASVRTTMESELDRDKPLDAVVLATDTTTDLTGYADRVAALDGVDAVATLPGAAVTVDGFEAVALGVDEAAAAVLATGAEPTMRPARGAAAVGGGVFADGVPVGQQVRVRGPEGVIDVRVELGRGAGAALLLHPDDLRAIAPAASPRALWVDAADDADAAELTEELTAVARSAGADLTSEVEDRAWVTLQLDIVLGATLGLLGASVLIALFGIANTLGLSVLERTRENALLRALGLTRRQLRATLAGEAALLTGVAGAAGVLIGTFYGWVGVRTLTQDMVDSIAVVVPVGQLALVVVAAGIAGLAASVLPARKAAATAPAAGLVAD
ncbi:FtsX-like permease family protein [Nocardioides massiliensis]|nr:ABC transporter permease [Nocardioides massiliensis]